VDIFGDHAMSCKKSGFGERHFSTQSFFCQVLSQARIREVDIAGNGRRPADVLLRAWDGRRDLAVDLTIVHPNPATGRPLRGSAATFLKDKGEPGERRLVWADGRGLLPDGTTSLLPGARPAAVGALRQGLSVQLGRSVARQLEALMMVATETPTWWAAALPAAPTFTAAGNPQW